MDSKARIEKRAVYPVGRREVWAAITKPDELVKRIGMDITDPDFWDAGLKLLDGMVAEVERLS